MPSDQRIDSFVLRVPDAWQELPLDASDLRSRAEANLQEGGIDTDDSAVRRFLLLVERVAAVVEGSGVVYAAAYFEPIPRTDSDELEEEVAIGALMSVVSLTTLRAEDLGLDSVPFDAMVVAAQEDDSPATKTLRGPEPVELPAGQAVHTQRVVVHHDRRAGAEVPLLVDRYQLLIGDGEGTAILTFMTPNLTLADELADLFRAIADTLEFTKV